MARVADYVIISDEAVSLQIGGEVSKEFTFGMPANFHGASRPILLCKLDTLNNVRDLKFNFQINGIQVDAYTFNDTVVHSIHEVLPANILKKNSNHIRIAVTGGDGELRVGDIFILCQVDT